jgi:hypothetical protein
MTGIDVTEFVASRDLKLLSDIGILIPHGEKRGRFYMGSPAILRIRDRIRDKNLVPDPYELVSKRVAAR